MDKKEIINNLTFNVFAALQDLTEIVGAETLPNVGIYVLEDGPTVRYSWHEGVRYDRESYTVTASYYELQYSRFDPLTEKHKKLMVKLTRVVKLTRETVAA